MQFIRKFLSSFGGPKSARAQTICQETGSVRNFTSPQKLQILESELILAIGQDRFDALQIETSGMSSMERENLLFFEKGKAVGQGLAKVNLPEVTIARPPTPASSGRATPASKTAVPAVLRSAVQATPSEPEFPDPASCLAAYEKCATAADRYNFWLLHRIEIMRARSKVAPKAVELAPPSAVRTLPPSLTPLGSNVVSLDAIPTLNICEPEKLLATYALCDSPVARVLFWQRHREDIMLARRLLAAKPKTPTPK